MALRRIRRTLACTRAVACAVLAVVWPLAGLAQPTEVAPSPAAACLTNVDGFDRPTYPQPSLDRKDGGTVHAQLTFDDSRSSPSVRIADTPVVFTALVDAVRGFARGLRVPCMAAGAAPVVLNVRYVFQPNDGRKVAASRPRDEADLQRSRQLKCLTNIRGEDRPLYPDDARRIGDQGNVMVRMVFNAPDKPPELEVLSSTTQRALRLAVAQFTAELRLPCYASEPVVLQRLYKFTLEGASRVLVKDLSLVQFLQSVKDVPRGVYFDLNKMGCPFDVRIFYMRPYRANGVGEIDATLPERQAFLDWLSGMTFALPEARNTAVLGQSFTVQVPCTVIDL